MASFNQVEPSYKCLFTVATVLVIIWEQGFVNSLKAVINFIVADIGVIELKDQRSLDWQQDFSEKKIKVVLRNVSVAMEYSELGKIRITAASRIANKAIKAIFMEQIKVVTDRIARVSASHVKARSGVRVIVGMGLQSHLLVHTLTKDFIQLAEASLYHKEMTGFIFKLSLSLVDASNCILMKYGVANYLVSLMIVSYFLLSHSFLILFIYWL